MKDGEVFGEKVTPNSLEQSLFITKAVLSSLEEDKNLASAVLQSKRKTFSWTEEHSMQYRNSEASRKASLHCKNYRALKNKKNFKNAVGDLFVRLLDSNRCR